MKRAALIVAVLAAVAVAGWLFLVPELFRGVVESEARKGIGPGFTVGNAQLNPVTGRATLGALSMTLGEGTSPVIRIDTVTVSLVASSLLSDPVEIREIVVSGMTLALEQQGLRLNTGRLLEHVRAYTAASDTTGVTVLVGRFRFGGGTMSVRTILGSRSVPMPAFSITDVSTQAEPLPLVMGKLMEAVVARATRGLAGSSG